MSGEEREGAGEAWATSWQSIRATQSFQSTTDSLCLTGRIWPFVP